MIVFPETEVVILHLKFAVIQEGVLAPNVGVVQALFAVISAAVNTVVELPNKDRQLAVAVDVDEVLLLLASAIKADVLLYHLIF